MGGSLGDDTSLGRGEKVGSPGEREAKPGATPLLKSDTMGTLGSPARMKSQEQRGPAEVTSLARVRARKAEPKSEIIEQIGRRLRSVYNEVLFQPIPDRFNDLIQALEQDLSAATSAARVDRRRKKESK